MNIVFLVILQRGVQGLLEAGLITAGLFYVFLAVSVIRKAGFSFSRPELRRMLAFGLPLIPGALGLWILAVSDRYFLQFLSTSHELGLYSLGYKFGVAIDFLLIGPFQLSWLPFVFSTAGEANAKEVFSRVLTYFLFVIILIALAISVLAKEVLAVMATPVFQEAYKVIPLITLSYVLYGCYFALNLGIYVGGKTKYLAVFVGASAVLNLGLNLLLVPRYGMMGAAVATLTCYLMLPIASYFISKRYYAVNYEWGRIVKIALAASLVYAASFLVGQSYALVHSHLIVGVFKLLTLLAYPILLYMLRFFKPEELQKAGELLKGAGRLLLRNQSRLP